MYLSLPQLNVQLRKFPLIVSVNVNESICCISCCMDLDKIIMTKMQLKLLGAKLVRILCVKTTVYER